MRVGRGVVTVAAGLAVAVGVAACGGDDESAERYLTGLPSPSRVVAADGEVWALVEEEGSTVDAELVEIDPVGPTERGRMSVPSLTSAVFVVNGRPWTASGRGLHPVDAPPVPPEETTDTPSLAPDSVVSVGGRVLASRDGYLYEISPATGGELQQVVLPPTSTGGEQVVLPTPMVVDGSHVWITVADGGSWRLQRFDPRAGTFDVDVRIEYDTTSAVLAGGRVWLADRHGSLLWIDAATGERHDVTAGFPMGETILDDGPSLFVGPDDSLWALDQPSQVVSQLDVGTGAVVASYELRYRPTDLAVTATDLIVANGFDDRVTVLPRTAVEPVTQPTT